MRIKRYKIDCEFHDRSPRSLPEVERRFTLPFPEGSSAVCIARYTVSAASPATKRDANFTDVVSAVCKNYVGGSFSKYSR